MTLFHAILVFMFWLILAYLAWTNSQAVGSIFQNGRDILVADTLALQGR